MADLLKLYLMYTIRVYVTSYKYRETSLPRFCHLVSILNYYIKIAVYMHTNDFDLPEAIVDK